MAIICVFMYTYMCIHILNLNTKDSALIHKLLTEEKKTSLLCKLYPCVK